MYVPMGASKTKHLNVWVIFVFVALWHDINYTLLIFGVGNAFTVFLEFLLDFGLKKLFKNHLKTVWYKYIKAA